MKLEIITPEREIFSGDIISVKLPGKSGEFEILNNHASIVSTLKEGEIIITKANKEKDNFKIKGGVIEMQENKIVVLANE